MKQYTGQSELTFGKYSGKTIKEVTSINPGYIIWCLSNLDHFLISKSELQILEKEFPSLHIPKETWNRVTKKTEEAEQTKQDYSYERP